MSMQMKAAPLDGVRQQRIRELETELGVQLVALHPETQLAELTKQQAERLAQVERELDVSLVAHESHAPLRLANPNRKQQQRIAEAEKETKLVLVAYELVNVKGTPFVTDQNARPAKLSDEQSRRLKTVENEVGLTLMAFEGSKRES
ncbi:MAG: hypothetical protein AABO58_15090 [Acidobacteriota bacterium]